ncbi:MAG: hypothetical protein C4532_08265 [Candidatus Abyssobacteria bacterium SURF_17]|uniref:Uncharacterized protein n=1 Tax=Candidatus Abyssobacteria bacterium SURF_17 TaxID=2093361 RepID=A0A419EZY9_9BACT|nr:MAG: hypothetical protein C4532_08265 [Candidatus Abyssubacteria bacterium SURF_17]
MSKVLGHETMAKSHNSIVDLRVRYRTIWKFIPLLLLPSVIVYLVLVSVRWTILLLGLIPLFVIIWDISVVYFSHEWRMVREVWKHLTAAEREQMLKLSLASGSKCAIVLGTTLWITLFTLAVILEVEEISCYVLAVLSVSAIEVPLHLQTLKPLIEFAFSTEYAKLKKYTKNTNIRGT